MSPAPVIHRRAQLSTAGLSAQERGFLGPDSPPARMSARLTLNAVTQATMIPGDAEPPSP
jgi:hypothetical protein